MFLSIYRNMDLCLPEVPALVCGLFSGRAEKYLTVKRQKTAAVLEHFHTGWSELCCVLCISVLRRQFAVK